jgi:hypothetical protein
VFLKVSRKGSIVKTLALLVSRKRVPTMSFSEKFMRTVSIDWNVGASNNVLLLSFANNQERRNGKVSDSYDNLQIPHFLGNNP